MVGECSPVWIIMLPTLFLGVVVVCSIQYQDPFETDSVAFAMSAVAALFCLALSVFVGYRVHSEEDLDYTRVSTTPWVEAAAIIIDDDDDGGGGSERLV
jgi:hypothetical protein